MQLLINVRPLQGNSYLRAESNRVNHSLAILTEPIDRGTLFLVR
jgi:hypothetical protein